MMRTFNMGVGLTLVVAASAAADVQSHVASNGCDCYPIGRIVKGNKTVQFSNTLRW